MNNRKSKFKKVFLGGIGGAAVITSVVAQACGDDSSQFINQNFILKEINSFSENFRINELTQNQENMRDGILNTVNNLNAGIYNQNPARTTYDLLANINFPELSISNIRVVPGSFNQDFIINYDSPITFIGQSTQFEGINKNFSNVQNNSGTTILITLSDKIIQNFGILNIAAVNSSEKITLPTFLSRLDIEILLNKLSNAQQNEIFDYQESPSFYSLISFINALGIQQGVDFFGGQGFLFLENFTFENIIEYNEQTLKGRIFIKRTDFGIRIGSGVFNSQWQLPGGQSAHLFEESVVLSFEVFLGSGVDGNDLISFYV